MRSGVILPGSVALAKGALAEGCPREAEDGGVTMAHFAARLRTEDRWSGIKTGIEVAVVKCHANTRKEMKRMLS